MVMGEHGVPWVVPAPLSSPPPSQDSSGSRSIYSTPTLPDRGEELPT